MVLKKKIEVKNGTFERFRVELIKVYLAFDCVNLFSNLKNLFRRKPVSSTATATTTTFPSKSVARVDLHFDGKKINFGFRRIMKEMTKLENYKNPRLPVKCACRN